MSSGAFSTVVDTRRELPAPMASDSINQTVNITGTSAQSALFANTTTLIRIFPTVDCFIRVAASPTATASHIFCAGGIYHFFGVKSGQRLAVINNGVNGVLYIMEVGE